MRVKVTPTTLWVSLTAAVLLAGIVLSPGQARAIGREALNRGVLSTVRIATVNAEGKMIASCSGTVIHPAGYVLTNWHCVGVPTGGEDASKQGLNPGDLYHPKGVVVLGPTKDAKQAPVPTYLAQALAGTPDIDFAVVKIVAMLKEDEPLPVSLPLIVMDRGDSDRLELGDPIHLVGYPGVGGDLVTVTSGIVSGFDDRNRDGQLDSIKTTAEMGGGISGGLAMNDQGEQIGVPTWGDARGASKIDRMMAINLAVPFVEQAMQRGGTEPGPPSAPAEPGAGTTPGSGPSAPPKPPGGTQTPPPAGQGVVLTGSIVDADTKRPIPNATLVVLEAGLTAEAWLELEGRQGNAAVGTTDQSGVYRTAPPLPRGNAHTVIVGAAGYVPRAFENGLEVGANVPGVMQMDPVSLKKR